MSTCFYFSLSLSSIDLCSCCFQQLGFSSALGSSMRSCNSVKRWASFFNILERLYWKLKSGRRMTQYNLSAELSFQSSANKSLNFTEPPLAVDERTLLGLKISLSVLLSVITLATILANVFVVITIFLTRKLHTPANYLIGSLAVTDLLVSVLVMPISIAYTVTHTWAFGQVLCDIWLSSDITCCTASILHLCVIALDRYWAITDALEYAKRRTAGRAMLMIAVVWMISISISVPPFFWS